MANSIKITPGELRSQAAQMKGMEDGYTGLFSNVTTLLDSINQNWSANLAHNFSGKITSAQRSFSSVINMLSVGRQVAEKCAESLETVDSVLANLWQNDTQSTEAVPQEEKPVKLDVEEYCEEVTDAEYARLCKLSYDALKEKDPEKAFIELLRSDKYLPENDPIKGIKASQVTVTESISG